MAYDLVQQPVRPALSASLRAVVAEEGSASHPYFGALTQRDAPMRDLADAAHFLCMLHARFPGLIDLARGHSPAAPMSEWLEAAASAFANERAFLVRLAAAAGPLPSTPGQDACDAAIQTQHHALDMLGRSDRMGCAAGAALALVSDWASCRRLLEIVADRVGLEAPDDMLTTGSDVISILDTLDPRPALERAIRFGAQQLVLQHRALWDILEARSEARQAML